MAIVTVSRQFGSAGDDICVRLSEKFGFRLVGKKILRERMRSLGCPESVIAKYDGLKPGFFASLSRDKDEYLYYLRTAILSESEDGDCVIAGRGAFLVLKDIESCVSFRIIEERKLRAARIMRSSHEMDEKIALKVLRGADRHQYGFHRSFFNFRIHDNFLYDMIINSGNCGVDAAASAIASYAREKVTPEVEKAGQERLNMLLLGQKIANMLVFTYDVKIDDFRVTVEGQTVVLNGVASSYAEVEKAWKIISLELPEFSFKSNVRIVQDYMKGR